MQFERFNRRNHDYAVGLYPRRAAFGLEEFFCAEVGAEAGFVPQAVAGDLSPLVAFSSLRSALTGRLTLTPEGAQISILPLPYKNPSAD